MTRVDVIPPESVLTASGAASQRDKGEGAGRFAPGSAPEVEIGLFERWLRSVTDKVGERGLRRLTGVSGSLKAAMASVPERMHRTAEQSRLAIELVEDVRRGRYRPSRWYTLPVAAAALLYAVSPADIVPDALPLAGTLDDILVVSVALRVLRRELAAYCRFKGYPESQFFDTGDTAENAEKEVAC